MSGDSNDLQDEIESDIYDQIKIQNKSRKVKKKPVISLGKIGISVVKAPRTENSEGTSTNSDGILATNSEGILPTKPDRKSLTNAIRKSINLSDDNSLPNLSNNGSLLRDKVMLMNQKLSEWKDPRFLDVENIGNKSINETKGTTLESYSSLDPKSCQEILDNFDRFNLCHIFEKEFDDGFVLQLHMFKLFLFSVVFHQDNHFHIEHKDKYRAILSQLLAINRLIDDEFQNKFQKKDLVGATTNTDIKKPALYSTETRTIESIKVPPLICKRLKIPYQ
jgi:hypothetical protein